MHCSLEGSGSTVSPLEGRAAVFVSQHGLSEQAYRNAQHHKCLKAGYIAYSLARLISGTRLRAPVLCPCVFISSTPGFPPNPGFPPLPKPHKLCGIMVVSLSLPRPHSLCAPFPPNSSLWAAGYYKGLRSVSFRRHLPVHIVIIRTLARGLHESWLGPALLMPQRHNYIRRD